MFKKLEDGYIDKSMVKGCIHKKRIAYHNKKYIKKESRNVIFNNINGYPLDSTQRKCILTDEKATLVVAGAGSGKSLTILGKIEYLINVKKINPLDILCISFTNETTISLKKKLNNNLVDIKTFHKLGLSILKENGINLNICESDTLDRIIDNYFNEILKHDLELLNNIITYLSSYIKVSTTYQPNNDIYNIISNYLNLNGINYKMDDRIYLIDYKLYINISDKIDNNINLPYSLYRENKLLIKLEEELKKRNIKLNPNFNLIKDNYSVYFINIKKLVKTFISIFKENNYQYEYLLDIIKQNKYEINEEIKRKNDVLLNIIDNVYTIYQEYLNKNNLMDFSDIINKASEVLDNGYINDYKYIIIDEYQDTSLTKYLLVSKIMNKTGAHLLAVGDDFQSIYGFTGCNLDIFIDFKKYYPDSKILKIEKTYRNSQELIDIAGNFIMKNKRQIRKNLISDKRLKKPIKICLYDDFNKTLKNIIDNIDTNILILGRNNKDINLLKDNGFKIDDDKVIYLDKDIRFLTVHKSKGLEADNVIIINVSNNILGFPNKLNDDPILKYLNNKKEYYPFEEERRLFYVAITRSKNNVYILTPKKNMSIFVKELMKDSNIEIKNFN